MHSKKCQYRKMLDINQTSGLTLRGDLDQYSEEIVLS